MTRRRYRDRGGELLRGHDEAAVSADGDDRPVAQGHGRADRRRERPAQRDVVGRIEEPSRAVGRPVRLHPIAHLAGVGEDGDVVGQRRRAASRSTIPASGWRAARASSQSVPQP